MKKKRFLKLVMSYGIQRDKAARMAARVGKFGSYEALFLSLRPSLAFWQMGAAVRKAGRTKRTRRPKMAATKSKRKARVQTWARKKRA